MTIYSKDNADAFVSEKPGDKKPQFIAGPNNKPKGKLTLSEMMQMKNENPDAVFDM